VLEKMRKNLKKRWKIIAFILLLTAGGLFWYYRTTEAQRVVVETIQPERGTLTKTLEVSGFVTAKEYVKMRFAAGGKVVFLGAQEGDWV
jgi:multidrug efflux pump subunit AcrA (membrane-fusion protein)